MHAAIAAASTMMTTALTNRTANFMRGRPGPPPAPSMPADDESAVSVAGEFSNDRGVGRALVALSAVTEDRAGALMSRIRSRT